MKRFLMILSAVLMAVACNDEDTLLTERDNIEKFLTSTRRMVVEEERENTIENNPPFYTIFGRYAYRYIVNFYESGREDRVVVESGDEIEVLFSAYTFTGSEPSSSKPYWSNVPEVIASLGKHGELAWSAEPLIMRLGSTDIIEGLDRSLVGCREQDSVQIFMTSSMAYGRKLIGSEPKNASLAWYMRIGKVYKR